MICILFNRIHFITRERGTCCVRASVGSCPIRRLSGETTTQQRFPRRRWREELLGFHCETRQPGAETGRSAFRRSAATAAAASRSADISSPLLPLYFHNNSTHTWLGEEMESHEMWTREAQTGNLVFRLSAPLTKVRYIMLERLGGNGRKKRRLRPHSSAGMRMIQKTKNKSCLMVDPPCINTNNSHLKCGSKYTELWN